MFRATLPLSEEEFNKQRGAYIAAVAASLRVPTSSVTSVKVIVPGGSRRTTAAGFPRRSLLSASVQVETAVKGVSESVIFSKGSLDAQLKSNGLPASEALDVVTPQVTPQEGALACFQVNIHPGIIAAASVCGGALLVLLPVVALQCRSPSSRVAPSSK